MDTIALVCTGRHFEGGTFSHDSLWNWAKEILTIFIVVANSIFVFWALWRLFYELTHEKAPTKNEIWLR